MLRPFANYCARLDAIYCDGPFFAGVRARLLAGFVLLLFVFVPLNITALLWSRPPFFPARIVVNLIIALAGLLALRLLFKGKLAFAGNALALALLVPAHAVAMLPVSVEPLSLGIKIFACDIVFLLAALVFASRPVAFVLLGIVVATHVAYYNLALRGGGPISGSLDYAAGTLQHDGLVAICFVFFLGFTVLHMVETAHQRSEESLRETRAMNEKLQRVGDQVVEHLADRGAIEQRRQRGGRAGRRRHEHEFEALGDGALAEVGVDLAQDRARVEPHGAERDLALLDRRHVEQIGQEAEHARRRVGDRGEVRAHPRFGVVALRLDHLGDHADFHRGVAQVVSGHAHERVLLFVEAHEFAGALGDQPLQISPAGKRVWLSAEPVVPGARVRFAVRDEGPGLSEEDRGKLFGKFRRLSAQPTGGESSNGLGLSIVKRLVDGMGGRIAVDSVAGQGATFRADFPAA